MELHACDSKYPDTYRDNHADTRHQNARSDPNCDCATYCVLDTDKYVGTANACALAVNGDTSTTNEHTAASRDVDTTLRQACASDIGSWTHGNTGIAYRLCARSAHWHTSGGTMHFCI